MRLSPLSLALGVVLLGSLLASCSAERLPTDAPEENKARLRAFWRGENPLYYLDLSGQSPIAFVLPHKAATLAPDAKFEISPDALTFLSGARRIELHLDEAPPRSGTARCMSVERTKLCEAQKE